MLGFALIVEAHLGTTQNRDISLHSLQATLIDYNAVLSNLVQYNGTGTNSIFGFKMSCATAAIRMDVGLTTSCRSPFLRPNTIQRPFSLYKITDRPFAQGRYVRKQSSQCNSPSPLHPINGTPQPSQMAPPINCVSLQHGPHNPKSLFTKSQHVRHRGGYIIARAV